MRTCIAIFLVATGIFFSFSPSSDAQWERVGRPGGSPIHDFAVIGDNLFAGTDQGVFPSADSGATIPAAAW